MSKIEACRDYGATLIEGGESLDEAVPRRGPRAEAAGMEFCHPYDDLAVIAGQEHWGRELVADVADQQYEPNQVLAERGDHGRRREEAPLRAPQDIWRPEQRSA